MKINISTVEKAYFMRFLWHFGFISIKHCKIHVNKDEPAYIFEFKVRDYDDEKSLEATVQKALLQIEEKDYDTDLISRGVKKENIYHYGFAFDGKEVLIG